MQKSSSLKDQMLNYRDEKGLSQREVGEEFGIGQKTISRIEKGGGLSPTTLRHLSRAGFQVNGNRPAKDTEKRFPGRRTKLSLYTVNKMLRERGDKPLSFDEVVPPVDVRVTGKQINQIKRALRDEGIVCLRRLSKNVKRAEFVAARFVQILPRRHFDKPVIAGSYVNGTNGQNKN